MHFICLWPFVFSSLSLPLSSLVVCFWKRHPGAFMSRFPQHHHMWSPYSDLCTWQLQLKFSFSEKSFWQLKQNLLFTSITFLFFNLNSFCLKASFSILSCTTYFNNFAFSLVNFFLTSFASSLSLSKASIFSK